MLKELIDEFEKKYGYRVVYVTQYGSKLFGTDNPNSDTDYKGIFIPNKRDVLLKKDIDHYTFNTGDTHTKNEKDDIDLQLYSIYKWFGLLRKGETGAIDLLFSLYREETQMFGNREFIEFMKKHQHRFYNRDLHSFIGYCVGQSKMYNIKGERYGELLDFVQQVRVLSSGAGDLKLESIYPGIQSVFDTMHYKYIRFVTAAIARGSEGQKEGVYVEVLGKRFLGTVTAEYFLQKVIAMEEQFGERSKASIKGVDYKALSHAVRVIDEVEELIDGGFISFPLRSRAYIRSIKEGHESLESVMNYIDLKLDLVRQKLETSDLPEKSDEAFIEESILDMLEWKI